MNAHIVPSLFGIAIMANMMLVTQARIENTNPIGRGRIVGWDRGGRRALQRLGRNQLCRCGSGRKFKKCCSHDHA